MKRCKEPKYAALGPPLNFDKPAPPEESRPLASENRLYPAPKERELPKCFDRNEVDYDWHSCFPNVHIRSATSVSNCAKELKSNTSISFSLTSNWVKPTLLGIVTYAIHDKN
uniref:Uncharacterized protein n=1 Tax=Glossina pallidipes TaxID=7398 RepID=A0A1B0A517_GLOPL